MKRKISKKAQHETVGFVLIIIIVAVIGLVFLWFFLQSPSKLVNSGKVSAMLSSSIYYTTDCYETYIPNYKNNLDLIKKCYESPNEYCGNGRKYCEILNDTFKEIINNSLKVGKDYPIKAYKLTMYFDPFIEEVANENFFILNEGKFVNCTLKYGGTNSQLSKGGNIEIKLELCERDEKRENIDLEK